MKRIVAVLIAAAAAGALYFAVYIPYRFNVVKKSSLRVLVAAVRSGNSMEASRAAQETLAALHPYEKICSQDFELWIGKAIAFTALGRHRDAAGALEQALTIEERPETWVKLAAAREALGDERGALEAMARAVAFHPRVIRMIPDRIRRNAVIRRAWEIRGGGAGHRVRRSE